MRSSVVTAFAFVCCAAANAAESVHFYIKTSAQGVIQGSSLQKGKEKWIEVSSWSVSSPRDPASGLATGREASTGLATGKRMHKPFSFTMSYGRCAQQLYQALCSNELVAECKIAITDDAGQTKWGNCMDVSFDRFTVIKSDNPQSPPTCEVSFNYTKIEWK